MLETSNAKTTNVAHNLDDLKTYDVRVNNLSFFPTKNVIKSKVFLFDIGMEFEQIIVRFWLLNELIHYS